LLVASAGNRKIPCKSFRTVKHKQKRKKPQNPVETGMSLGGGEEEKPAYQSTYTPAQMLETK